MVVENLGTRTTWSRRPHAPEIVIGRDADNPVFGHTDLFPHLERFIVCMVNGRQQLGLVDAKVLGQQFPSKRNSLGFEVVAETACPHTFLTGGRALVVTAFYTREPVLELHHARVGEHQRRVIARHKRAGRHDRVVLTLEIIKEGA